MVPRQLIADAVEAELQELLNQYAEFRNEQGHLQVVRNGYLPEREIQTGIGPVKVKVPKIRDKSGQGIKFNSALLPPYLRKTRSVEEVLPWLYLKGFPLEISRKHCKLFLEVMPKGCQHRQSVA